MGRRGSRHDQQPGRPARTEKVWARREIPGAVAALGGNIAPRRLSSQYPSDDSVTTALSNDSRLTLLAPCVFGSLDRPALAETVGQVTGLTLVQRRAATVAIRHKRTGRPGKGPILDGQARRPGGITTSPARHSGWRRHPKWSARASRCGAEMVVALSLCRTVAGAASGRSTSCPGNSSASSPPATRDQRRARAAHASTPVALPDHYE